MKHAPPRIVRECDELKASISPTTTLFIGRDMIFNVNKHKDDFENEEDGVQYVFELAMVAASFDKKPEDLTDIDIARARKKMKKYGIDLSVDLWK